MFDPTRARTVLLAVALGLALACGLDNQTVYQGTGTVVSVGSDRKQVKISHGEIPDLMPAMTMNFDVARPELLEGVEPGASVRFELERRGNLLRILSIEVTAVGEAGASGTDTSLELDEPAPAFTLTDHEGRPLSLEDLRGSAILLDFVFTRCEGPCPMLTSAHAELQRRLPPELSTRTRFLSVSVDPRYDTPERLKRYAEERGANLDGWSFLTGDPEAVAAVLRDYHVGTVLQEGGAPEHVVVTYLIDPQGRIARRYLGLSYPEADLLRDLRQVLS